MKAVTKICLIVACIAAVLGLAGLGAGMALGASPDEFLDVAGFETRKVLKPGSLGEERALESGNVVSPEDYTVSPSDYYVSPSDDVEEIHCGNLSTEDLEVELSAGVLHMYLHEGEDIVLEGDNLGRFLEIEEDGDKVSIQGSGMKHFDDHELILYLPDRLFREVELEVGAAEVIVECLNAEEVSVDLGAGSLTLTLAGSESDYAYTVDCGAGTVTVGENAYSGLANEICVGHGRNDEHPGHNGHAWGGKNLDVDCGLGEVLIMFEED